MGVRLSAIINLCCFFKFVCACTRVGEGMQDRNLIENNYRDNNNNLAAYESAFLYKHRGGILAKSCVHVSRWGNSGFFFF